MILIRELSFLEGGNRGCQSGGTSHYVIICVTKWSDISIMHANCHVWSIVQIVSFWYHVPSEGLQWIVCPQSGFTVLQWVHAVDLISPWNVFINLHLSFTGNMLREEGGTTFATQILWAEFLTYFRWMEYFTGLADICRQLRYHIIDKPGCWKTMFRVHTTAVMIWVNILSSIFYECNKSV